MDSGLFHLIEEFILKEFDSHDVEYTPRSARLMRRNLNKTLNELAEMSDSVKEEKKRKRDELDNGSPSENDSESNSESDSNSQSDELDDKDYDDSEHKYNYNESIILPVNIKYCLGIAYISIIFSVYTSMFYIVTTYSYELNNINNSNISKSCL